MYPEGNLPVYLSLISITKDAERIGDYIKNIIELKDYMKDAKKDSLPFVTFIDHIHTDLSQAFDMTVNAFRNSEKDTARSAMELCHKIAQECQESINLSVKNDYTRRQAIILSLGSHYIKRIICHLQNTLSSLVNPVPYLDFFTESSLPIAKNVK
jgi:phosphate uptake regulator